MNLPKNISFNKRTIILIIGIVLALLITLGSQGLFSFDHPEGASWVDAKENIVTFSLDLIDPIVQSYQKVKLLLIAY